MIKNGKGGSKTKTGLLFEERTNLKKAFSKLKNYDIKKNEILKNKKTIGKLLGKHKLYSELLTLNGVNFEKYISKKLLPDEAILIYKTNTLFIIEMKFQEVAGSVDEKLQTCDFKRKQYIKLLKPLNIKVEYIYILNDWFKNKKYKDVLKYIRDNNCHYFFEELPLKFLSIED